MPSSCNFSRGSATMLKDGASCRPKKRKRRPRGSMLSPSKEAGPTFRYTTIDGQEATGLIKYWILWTGAMRVARRALSKKRTITKSAQTPEISQRQGGFRVPKRRNCKSHEARASESKQLWWITLQSILVRLLSLCIDALASGG